jgi:hypothetical protein
VCEPIGQQARIRCHFARMHPSRVSCILPLLLLLPPPLLLLLLRV